MTEAGWAPTLTDTGKAYGYPVGQEAAFAEADSECVEVSGILTVASEPDEATLRDGYQRLLNARQCLINEGFEVAEAPSVSVHIENPTWSPYTDLSISDFQKAEEVCPQDGFL